MNLIRRFSLFTQSFYSIHHLTACKSVSKLTSLQKFDLRDGSSSATSAPSAPTNQVNEVQTTDSDEKDRQVKFIHLEISLLRQMGGRAPDVNFIKEDQWEELLTLNSKSSRHRFYAYLVKLQKMKECKVLKQQQKRESKEHALEPLPEGMHIQYGIGKTTLMLRIGDKVMNSWRHTRLIRAMQFGEKLIFDCSYDQNMTKREAKSAAKQLTICFSANRKNRQPFDLHFCNVNFDSAMMKQLERNIPTMRNKGFPMNFHECSYLKLFPKNELVYLTSHCQNDLTEYDPNMTYIIGTMVDKTNHEPLSLAKAKELNLKMARLPLEAHLDWGTGSDKSLTLDQMTNIMLDLKSTRNWQIALQHVPKRKVRRNDDYQNPEYVEFLKQSKKLGWKN